MVMSAFHYMEYFVTALRYSFFYYSQSPHLIRCAGGEKYQELFGDMYLAVIV